MKLDHVLVVGGGMAGLHTARLLRENGFAGEVTLLGAEPHRPYDRPPLSKQVLQGTMDGAEELAFPFDFGELKVAFRPGERAVSWTPGAVTTDRGAVLTYDALVVATGSEPVRPGFAAEAGWTLRTYEDAVRLRAALDGRKRLGIVGAGWIGAEVATAARAAGCEVQVFEAQDWPLQALFPEEIGRAMARWYEEAGASLWLSLPVTQIDRGEYDFSELEDFPEPKKYSDVEVTVENGEYMTLDEVLVAVGARPDHRWLGASFEYAADGALLVDAQLRAAGVNGDIGNVFAVGDCAAYYSERHGRHLRVEHWDNALRGPAVVADNVLGGSAEYDPVPYFWSEQFGRMVQYAGRHGADDRMVVRGDLDAPAWSACWLDAAGRLTAVLAVGRPRDLAQGRRLVTDGTVLDAARLADPGTALTAAAV